MRLLSQLQKLSLSSPIDRHRYLLRINTFEQDSDSIIHTKTFENHCTNNVARIPPMKLIMIHIQWFFMYSAYHKLLHNHRELNFYPSCTPSGVNSIFISLARIFWALIKPKLPRRLFISLMVCGVI